MTRADHLGGIFPFRSLSLCEQWWSIGFILSFLGLAFSQALFTITLFGLSIAVVVEQLQKGAPVFSRKAIGLLICPWLFVLVIPVIQCIVSSTWQPLASTQRIHLVQLPLISLRLFFLTKKAKEILIDTALLICCVCAVILLIVLVNDWSTVGHSIEEGKHLWVPNGHPKTTAILFVTIGILGVNYTLGQQKRPHFRIVSTVFLLCCVHAMTVRIAWGMLYVGVAFALCRYFVKERQWKPLLIGTLALLTTPYLLYQSIPSVKKRIDYTLYDWSTFSQDGEANTSDALRIISWDVGWKTVMKQPLLGYGGKSMDEELAKQYALHYPAVKKENILKPHNQFLFFALEYGLPGAFFSLFAMGCLMWYFGRSTGIVLCLVFLLYCFIDSPMYRQMINATFWYGLGFSLMFVKETHAS